LSGTATLVQKSQAFGGKAALAIIVVDRQGQLVESPAVGISNFGWGVIAAVNGELAHN
jgi:hypothetical protein